MANPTFFSVARQPKWIGALFLSLAVAAIFAALGQWQLDRAFTKDNQVFAAPSVTRELAIDQSNVYIVANRLQDNLRGYWLITNAYDTERTSYTMALGWSSDLAEVEAERDALKTAILAQAFMPFEGVLLPSEGPQKLRTDKPYIVDSLSLAQLVNLYSPDKPIAANKEYLALCACGESNQAWPPLRPIKIDMSKLSNQINWLSAFYFLEWMLFAGFAVFLWWRLVQDEILRLKSEGKLAK
ncbi:MAG: hypothetical protein ACKOWH_02465 [Rhodoluna sp.]